jgi:hypothetical protein
MNELRFAAVLLTLACVEVRSQEFPPPAQCIPIDRADFIIDKPGTYCMVKDIHTRFDFADHSAEGAIANIRSSNVTIDMRGHRGGRGVLFTQHGGNGFKIENESFSLPYTNIEIKNGTLTDFDYGVYFYRSEYKVNP